MNIALDTLKESAVAGIANALRAVDGKKSVADNRQIELMTGGFERTLFVIDGDLINEVAQAQPSDHRSVKRIGIKASDLRHIIGAGTEIIYIGGGAVHHARQPAFLPIVHPTNEHCFKFTVNGFIVFITGGGGVGDIVGNNVRALGLGYHAGGGGVNSSPHSFINSFNVILSIR